MDISERLDVRSLIKKTSQASFKTGIIFLVVVPAILFGIGWLVGRQHPDGRIPTFIWVIIGLSALLGIVFIGAEITDKLHPENHDAVKWAGIGTPDEIIRLIEDDWNNTPPESKYQCGDYFLTQHWLLHIDSLGISSYPLQYFAWAYFTSKAKYVNGIPTGTDRNVVFHRIDSKVPKSILVDSDESGAQVLFALQKRAPWGFYGYTEAYHNGWNHDMEGFIAKVKERYSQSQSGHPIEQPETQFQPEPLSQPVSDSSTISEQSSSSSGNYDL